MIPAQCHWYWVGTYTSETCFYVAAASFVTKILMILVQSHRSNKAVAIQKANIIQKMTQCGVFHLVASHVTSIIMSPLTVVSMSEAQANMDVGHGVVVTIAVTYKMEVIVVVDKVLFNNKQ